MARDPVDAYGALARRYGDAIRLPLGRRRSLYLLSRPEHAEHVLVSRQDNYPKAITYQPLRAFLGDGLLTSEGETWRRHRRLVQPAFAHRQVAGLAPRMVAVTADATARWACGDTVDIAGELRRTTLDIVGRALFGAELAGDADATGRALALLQRGVLVGIAGSLLPIRSDAALRTVFRVVPNLARAHTHLDTMTRRVVADRRSAAADEQRDLLDVLMAPGDGDEPALDDRELHEEILTLLLAGHETTSAALTWTLVLLSRYPAARERLEAEVDEVLAGRQPLAADADRLPWTRAVLFEAMRLYAPAWTVEREALCDDTVAGIDVPAGTVVVISPYLIHRHPELWPNPEGFDPHRFIGSSDRPRYAYLPFGGGRRICVGAGFATLEATLILATISQTHRLDLLPGVTVPARAEITLYPAGPVPMRVSRRAGPRLT